MQLSLGGRWRDSCFGVAVACAESAEDVNLASQLSQWRRREGVDRTARHSRAVEGGEGEVVVVALHSQVPFEAW